jgi:hypothetical protein
VKRREDEEDEEDEEIKEIKQSRDESKVGHSTLEGLVIVGIPGSPQCQLPHRGYRSTGGGHVPQQRRQSGSWMDTCHEHFERWFCALHCIA